MKTSYKVATRESKLALIQTQISIDNLKKLIPSSKFDIIKIKTAGDINRTNPIFSINEKGIFEKEVNSAIIEGKADFAVHSIKDIPTDLDNELVIASILKREKPNDVLIGKSNLKLKDLLPNSSIGTSSLRRAIQLLRKNPQIRVYPIRGNVETRIKKCMDGSFDAVVLAEAGIRRLNMIDLIVERFNYLDFLPSPGQGAIGIVCRRDNEKIINLLRKIEHKPTRYAIDTERSLICNLNAGCRFPVGAIALPKIRTNKIELYASVFSADGSKSINLKKANTITNLSQLGKDLANELLFNGAEDFAHEWRDAVKKWIDIK